MSSLLTANAWSFGASGLWSVAGNWSLGRTPNSTDFVDIEAASPFAVTFDVASLGVAALTLSNATLTLQGGPLSVAGATNFAHATVNGANALTLSGATNVFGLALGGATFLYNKGQVTQYGADVTLSGAASIRNLAGATWTLADDSGITLTQGAPAGWRMVNAGTLRKSGGSGLSVIRANVCSTGTISSDIGGTDIVFDGAYSNLSGTYTGPGMVDYGADGVSTVGVTHVTLSCCQTAFGTVNLVGDMTLDDGSTIMLDMGSHWNFAGDSSLLLTAGQSEGPVIDGMGVIAKTKGTGVSHIGIDLSTEGAINVMTGALSLDGASSAFSGPVYGAGTLRIGGGAATVEAGAKVYVANWSLAGGTTTLGENLGYAGAFSGGAGATLALGGHYLTLTGQAALSGLALSGAGGLAIYGATTLSGLGVGAAARVIVASAATQSGGDAVLAAGASLSIAAGGAWTLADSHAIRGGVARINAGGRLAHDGTGQGVVAATIYNYGTLAALSGALDVSGAVWGQGVATIQAGASLEFEKNVAGSQSIAFAGSGAATLQFDDLADAYAKISGFDGSGDTILIGGGWTFAGATETATAATLNFANGAAHHALTLQGDYRSGAFVTHSNAGLLSLTYNSGALPT